MPGPILYTAFDETKTLTEWLKDPRCKVGTKHAFYRRIKKLGWDIETALKEERRQKWQMIPGQRFGRLVLVSRIRKIHNYQYLWLCQCDCGNTKEVSASYLYYDVTRSCGCLMKESSIKNGRIVALPYGLAARNAVLQKYKNGALTRNLKWELSNEKAYELFEGECHYCGRIKQNMQQAKANNGPFEYNGIDRLDNALGYIEGNVVSCCKDCNYAKKEMSVDEFLHLIELIYQKHFITSEPF